MTSSAQEQEPPSHPRGPAERARRRGAKFTPANAAAVAAMFNNSEEGWPGGFTDGVPMTAERVLRLERDVQPLATFIAWDGDTAAGYCSLFDYPGERGVDGYLGLLT